ncbi:MAG: PfkB family carbohydrate kinase [Pirellulales bacterium]
MNCELTPTRFAPPRRAAQVVVLSGSLPQGTPADYYATLLDGFQGRAILDVRGPELLAALPHRPWLVKPNREELGKTVGRTLLAHEEIVAAMRAVQAQGARNVAVTHGPAEVLLLTESGDVQRFVPPRIPTVVNPIGSGDSFAAGAAVSAARDDDPIHAVKLGIAAAAANVETLLPARWAPGRVEALLQSF